MNQANPDVTLRQPGVAGARSIMIVAGVALSWALLLHGGVVSEAMRASAIHFADHFFSTPLDDDEFAGNPEKVACANNSRYCGGRSPMNYGD